MKDYPKIKFEFKSLNGFIKVDVLNLVEKNVPANVPVNSRQKDIIRKIEKNKNITQTELSKQYNVNRETIKRDLKKLKEHSIIKRVGSDKTAHWIVVNPLYK